MKFSSLLLSPVILACGLSSSHAQPSAPPQVESSAPKHVASLTLSPVHLAIGIVELTSEFRVGDQMGVAATLGGGQVSGVALFEAGAQLSYYFTGSFDGGLHIGAEAQLLRGFSDGDESGTTQTRAAAEGLALGPLLGWKWVGAIGFSFVAQGGVQYMAVQAKASNGSASASSSDSRVGALVNLNAGWSF